MPSLIAPTYPVNTATRVDTYEVCEFCSFDPAPAVWHWYFTPTDRFDGLISACESADCYRWAEDNAWERCADPELPDPVAECHHTYRSAAERAELARQAPAVAHQRHSVRWCTCGQYLPRDVDWWEHQRSLEDAGLVA